MAEISLCPDGATIGPARLEIVVGDIARQPEMDAVVNAANASLLPGAGVAGAIHRAAGPGLYAECRPLAPIRTGQAVITGAHQLPNRWVIHCLGPVYRLDQSRQLGDAPSASGRPLKAVEAQPQRPAGASRIGRLSRPAAELLASCYRQALFLAQAHGAAAIAFPAISTGVFGYPKPEAAEVALDAVLGLLPLLAATWRRPERQRASVAGRRSPAAATGGSVQNRAAEPPGIQRVRFVLFTSAERGLYRRVLEALSRNGG